MTILYFFQEIGTAMFQWQRTHIINELKHHGCIVEVFNPLLFDSADISNKELIKRINRGGIDLFFTNVCYYKMLYIDTLNEIKRIGIPTLCLRCDNLVIPYNDQILAPHFDLVWLTSIETKHLYDKWGVKSFFAPYAANPYTFTYQEQSICRKVSFIGRPYGSRSIMINALTKGGVDTDIFYGLNPNSPIVEETINAKYNIIQQPTIITLLNRLRFKEGRHLLIGKIVNSFRGETKILDNPYLTKHYAVYPSKICNFYSKYALSLASTSTNHTDILKKPLKIVNLRNFEIPMSGGIEICKYNPELATYFEEDKEIIFYKSNDELVDKAIYYTQKATDKHLCTIKHAARKRAVSQHTWWNRFNIAFNILGLKV